MGKRDLKAMAKNSIKIISNNKIKLRRGQKISIKPIVEESIKGATISRLEGIIPDNTDKYDASHIIKSEATLLSQIKISDIVTHTANDNMVPTIVHVCTKKNSLDFDFAGEGIIGDLLRTSTLGPTYNKIKNGWKNLNTDDKTTFTNVMFIPNILVFSNGIETLFSPFKVNLLLVSVPSFKLFKENAPEDSKNVEVDYIGRIYGDIMDSAIKISGCSDLIINPFDIKISKEYPHDVVDMWNYLIDSSMCRKSISSIWFSITDDEFHYVLFITEKGIKKSSNVIASADDSVMGDDDDDDEEFEDIADEIISDMESSNEKKKKNVKDALDD